MTPLDFTFTPMSATSHRAPWSIDLDEQEAELRDELADRRDLYPALVAKGRGLTQEDADRHILVWDEIVADCTVIPADVPADRWGRLTAEARRRRLEARILWEEKVREIRREIAIRRRSYAGKVEKGRMLAGIAHEKIERLEAVHWRYWITGFVWSDCLQDRAPADVARLFRDFEVPRIEWHIAAIDAGERWAQPDQVPDRAWAERYCRTWRADRACGLVSMEEAAS